MRMELNRLKAEWQKILGSDGSGKGAICPLCGSGSGKHGTGMTLIKGSQYELKCFACGESGDVIKVVCDANGWSEQADFYKAVEYCAQAAGIDFDYNDTTALVRKDGTAAREPHLEDIYDDQLRAEMSQRFSEWNSRLKETDYWARRGLSFETVNRFKCGFAPQWRHPTWSQKVQPSPRFIIPTSPIGYLARETRPDGELDEFWTEKKKVKYQRQGIFNYAAVKEEVLFIVEGEIDAMSIEECGYPAVGLGSISMVNKFISMLDRDSDSGALKKLPRAALVALDNEQKKQVQLAKKKLTEALNERGINTLDGTQVSGECKDANELLVVDRAQLEANCAALYQEAAQLPRLEKKNQSKGTEAKHEATPIGKGKKSAEDKSIILTGTKTTVEIFSDSPADLLIPDGYTLSDDGLIIDDELVASRNVIIPMGFVINHHSREQQIELALRTVTGNWEYLTVEMSTVSDKNKIIELTNRGLRTTSGDAAKGVVKYIFDIIGLNEGKMPVKEEYDQPGWSSDLKEFRMPWNSNYYMPTMEKIYETAGDLHEWLLKAAEVCRRPLGRLMLGTAFAAPLMRILGQRSFGLYLYGNSKAGKSAIQKFAISAFGNPNRMMGTFNATMNGLETLCTRTNDLPLLLDESTEAKADFDFSKFQYIVSGEQTRVRMDRDLNQRPLKFWRLPVLMNGEGRMYDDASREGAMNRTLEIGLEADERIFGDESEARSIHKFVEQNYGLAGQVFITELLKLRVQENAEDIFESHREYAAIKDDYEELNNRLKEKHDAKHTLEQIALMALIGTGYAWYLKIFEGSKIALDRAENELCNPNMTRLPTAEQLKEEGRAWRHLVEYCQSHPNNFYGEHHYDAEGKKKNNLQTPVLGEMKIERVQPPSEPDRLDLKEVLLLPTMAAEILSAKGFNPTKLLKAFRYHGWIESDASGKNPQRRWAGSSGKKQRMIVIPSEKFQPDF